jgi:hypothetical protein
MTQSDATMQEEAAPSSRTPRTPDSHVTRVAWGAALALFSLLLLYIAVPRMAAAILRVPGEAGFEAMDTGEPVTAGMLDLVIDSRRAAARWVVSGRISNAVGLAAMQLLEMMEELPLRQPEEEARYLATAIESLQDGLSKEPAQPFAWYQFCLALLKRGQDGDASRAERAWRMAIATGENEPVLRIPRVALGMLMWSQLSPRSRQVLAIEVESAALSQPRALARLSLQLGTDEFIRTILAEQPSLLATYNEMARLPEAGAPLFP